MRQSRLADSRQVFNQNVATRQQSGNGQLDLLLFTKNNLVDLRDNGMEQCRHVVGRCCMNCLAMLPGTSSPPGRLITDELAAGFAPLWLSGGIYGTA